MKRTLWGLFFVATMLSSCKKEDPNSPSFTQSSQKEMKSTDAYISFDMEVDQPKALNFDINADGLPLLIREDKIKVYCSIVESGTTSPNFRGGGFVELKRVPGTTNTFRAKDAAIKMRVSHPWTENNIGTRCTMSCAIIPMTAEEENLAKDGILRQAMIIQQSTPNTPAQATVVHPNDKRVTLNIPYFSSEVRMEFKPQPQGEEIAGRALAKVKIKPYGTLLRHRFVNKTTQPISIKRFGLFTTGFSQNIAVDLDNRNLEAGKDFNPTLYPTARIVGWDSGSNRYQVDYSTNHEQKFSVADYELQTPLHIPAGQTSDAYILTWGYPHSDGLVYLYEPLRPTATVKYPRVIRVYYAETETGEKLAVSGYKINYSYLPPAGTSYTVTSTINRPRLPIDYILYANLTGNSRLSTFNPEPVGTDPKHSRPDVITPKLHWDMMHVSIGDATDDPAKIKANKFGHNPLHIPTPQEWRSICADSKDVPNTNGAKKTGVSEPMKFGNVSGTFTADYKKSNDGKVLYGLRLKGDGDKYLSAWRYASMVMPGTTSSPTLNGPGGWPAFGLNTIIQVRHLGPGSPVTIDDIAQENWWTTNNQNDEVRAFPHVGVEDWYQVVPGHGREIYPGTVSYYGVDPTNGMLCWFFGSRVSTPVHKSTQHNNLKYIIRPFFDK